LPPVQVPCFGIKYGQPVLNDGNAPLDRGNFGVVLFDRISVVAG
jgi:hypothetical protein